MTAIGDLAPTFALRDTEGSTHRRKVAANRRGRRRHGGS